MGDVERDTAVELLDRTERGSARGRAELSHQWEVGGRDVRLGRPGALRARVGSVDSTWRERLLFTPKRDVHRHVRRRVPRAGRRRRAELMWAEDGALVASGTGQLPCRRVG